MSRRKPLNKREDGKWLNFPDLYDLIEENLSTSIVLTDSHGNKVSVKRTNAVIIALIFGVARTDNADKILDGDLDSIKNLSSEASAFMTKRPLPQDIVDAYHDVRNREYVYNYVTNEIYSQMTNVEQLDRQLKNLINNTPSFPQKEEMQKEQNIAKLLTECIKISTSHKVRVINEKKLISEEIEKEKEEIPNLKESQKNNIISSTHAITIVLEGESLKYPPFNLSYKNCEFHDFDSLLDYIMKNNLLILKVYSLHGVIKVFVMPSKYHLKQISETEYVDAIAFLGTYQDSFRAKKKWPKYSIACLASNGLKEKKWIPYGYYIDNELVGYIDFKYTIGNGVELGIELIDEEHRSLALATSLLYFVRLKFPTLYTYSGTYEENMGMRSTFESADYIIDVKKGDNGIIRDRVNKEHPEDESLYTNSIYYIAKPLLDEYASN